LAAHAESDAENAALSPPWQGARYALVAIVCDACAGGYTLADDMRGASIPWVRRMETAATYDAVYLLRDVIARSGPRREAVRRALAGVGSATPAFEGVTGAVSFDVLGDVPNQNVYIGLVHRGRIEVENQATAVAEAP
jgi:hypothetical protein